MSNRIAFAHLKALSDKCSERPFLGFLVWAFCLALLPVSAAVSYSINSAQFVSEDVVYGLYRVWYFFCAGLTVLHFFVYLRLWYVNVFLVLFSLYYFFSMWFIGPMLIYDTPL